MVHYLYCLQLFLIIALVDARMFPDGVKKRAVKRFDQRMAPKKDSVFADVIKNITRVNSVLEDLIKNYEKLQKIYKSQESLTEHSSEDDGEDNSRNKQKVGAIDVTTKKSDFPATEMFVSENEQSVEKKEPQLDKNKVEENGGTNAEHIKRGNKKNENKIVQKKQDVVSEDSSPESEVIEDKQSDHSNEEDENIATWEASNKTQNDANNKKTDSEKFVKIKKVSPKLVTENDKASKPISDTTGEAKFVQQYEDTNEPHEISTTRTQTRKYKKKIIKAEEFPQENIWDVIRNNKPVHLKTEKEIIYSKRKRRDNVTILSDKETKKLNLGEAKSTNKPKKEKELSPGSLEDEKVIMKEQFKTRILRKAYGDACLKVVIKKCYKACKEMIKRACKQYSCKTNLKQLFLQHSKAGCINEFQSGMPAMRRANDGGKEIAVQPIDGFHDITKNGYLAAACLPSRRSNEKIQGGNKTLTEKDGEFNDLNILRDRFERACQKTSYAKCTNACHYAVNETCKTLECHGNKKSAMRKFCKKECKRSYRYNKDGSSDSSGTESSDSSKPSDTDSGFEISSYEKSTTPKKEKTKDPKDPKKIKDLIDPIKTKDSKDLKNCKDSKPSKKCKNIRDTKKLKDRKESKDNEDLKDNEDAKDYENSKDHKE